MSRRAVVGVVILLGFVAAGFGGWLLYHISKAPRFLAVNTGNCVVIVGNTLAERMQYFGHFETLLHSRFPNQELVVRNLGFSGDEVMFQPRSDGYWKHKENT